MNGAFDHDEDGDDDEIDDNSMIFMILWNHFMSGFIFMSATNGFLK